MWASIKPRKKRTRLSEKVKKWDLDELKKADIEPTLKNYLLWKDKSCKNCPIHEKWGACPAYPTSIFARSPKRSAFARRELGGGYEGHVISWRCPIIVH
jgi:hypothetical protein